MIEITTAEKVEYAPLIDSSSTLTELINEEIIIKAISEAAPLSGGLICE